MPVPTSRHSAGITLVETCVILAAVTILVIIVLPALTSEVIICRSSAVVQHAKGLGNVFSVYAADHSACYPDAPTSTALFANLLREHYLVNGDPFHIANAPGKTKYPGAGPLTAANVSWDVMGRDDPATGRPLGVPTSADENLPLIFSTGSATGLRFPPRPVGAPFELTLGPASALDRGGVVVLYQSMGVKTVRAGPKHPGQTLGFLSGAYQDPTTYTVRNP